jgi:ankyrin repeat protein
MMTDTDDSVDMMDEMMDGAYPPPPGDEMVRSTTTADVGLDDGDLVLNSTTVRCSKNAATLAMESISTDSTLPRRCHTDTSLDLTTTTTTTIVEDSQTLILELDHEGSSGVSLTSTEESSSSPKRPNRCQSSISVEEKILMSPSATRAVLETRRIQERVAALRTHSPRSVLGSNSGDNTKEDGQKDPYVFHLSQGTGTSVRQLSPASGEALRQMAQAPPAKSGSVPENRGQVSSDDTNTRPQSSQELTTMMEEATKKTGPQMPLAPTPVLEEEQAQDLLPRLLDYVKRKKWKRVVKYLEQDPSLSRREVSMICQGETSKCLLVHLLSGSHSTPISVIDTLVTLNPGSLLQPEERGGRLPIHLAVVKGASHGVVQQLCNTCPQALQVADEEGNHPVHYAAMYGSFSMLRLIVQAHPEACRVLNQRDRFPLHLVCARCFDADAISPGDLENIIDAHPEAIEVCDRFGRMPLHLASQVQQPQWELLETLIRRYPTALVHRDKARNTPLMLARKKRNFDYNFEDSQQYDLLVSSLAEYTQREGKKQNPYLPAFLFVSQRKKTKSMNVDLSHCYG